MAFLSKLFGKKDKDKEEIIEEIEEIEDIDEDIEDIDEEIEDIDEDIEDIDEDFEDVEEIKYRPEADNINRSTAYFGSVKFTLSFIALTPLRYSDDPLMQIQMQKNNPRQIFKKNLSGFVLSVR